MMIRLAALAVVTAALASPGQAQSYPDRPIRVVIPFPAGGAADVLARIVLEKAAATIGQPFVIENTAGAGGNTGTAAVLRAEPDGYRVTVSASGPLAANKTLSKNLPYDPEKDLEPVTLLATMPNIIVVTNTLQVNSLRELIEHAKVRPGELNYSSIGPGSSQHLAGAYFEQLTGTRMTHVPYRASPQLVTDLVTGVVPLSFNLIPNLLGQLQAGQLKPLAVTSTARSPAQPNVPTTVEAGMPQFISSAWFAMVGPKGMPKPIVDKLNQQVVAAVKDPATNKRLIEAGIDPATSTPEELRTFISAEVVKWRDVINKAGIKVD
jgi:tripartite-type tricarboxylate transporter receptor subunit TctC